MSFKENTEDNDDDVWYECHICGKFTHEYDVVMSPYGDPYCFRCDEFKKKFPRKTPAELLSIMPKESTDLKEKIENDIKLIVILVFVLAIALIIL